MGSLTMDARRLILATLLLLPLLAPLAAAEDAPPGIAIDPAHQDVAAGETAVYNLTVTNPGDAPMRVHVEAGSDGWSTGGALLNVTMDAPDAVVAPRGEARFALRVETTNDTLWGFHGFRVNVSTPDGPAPLNATTFSVFVTPSLTSRSFPMPAPGPLLVPPVRGLTGFNASLPMPNITLQGFMMLPLLEVELMGEGGSGSVLARLEDVDGAFGEAFDTERPPSRAFLAPGVTTRMMIIPPVMDAAPGDHLLRIHLWVENDPNLTRILDVPVHVVPSAIFPIASPSLPIVSPSFPIASPFLSRAGLAVERPADPIGIAPGGEARVAYVFLNQGEATLAIVLEPPLVAPAGVQVWAGASADGFTAAWEGARTFELAPGARVTRTILVNAPADAAPDARLTLVDASRVLGTSLDVTGEMGLTVAGPVASSMPAAVPSISVALPPEQQGTADAQPSVTADPGLLRTMGEAAKTHPLAFGSIGVGLGALGLAALLRKEAWRYGFLAGLVPLYTRLKTPKVLDHATRDALLQIIRAEPGIHYSALQSRTGLNTGALVHHLRTLERHGLALSRREGALRRFYPVGAGPLPPLPTDATTPTQARVLAILDEGPRTQRELAERLGLTQQGANHHVKTLERKGLLMLETGPDGVARCHRLHALHVER